MDSENDSAFLAAIMAVIEEHYGKPQKIADAELFYTTQQILDEIKQIYPALNCEILSEMLYIANYKFQMIGDMKFAWLLSRR